MTLMKLTPVDPGSPPLSINPRHVVSVKARRVLKPNQATQGVHLINSWEGATVELVTGRHHNVVEDHDTIVARVNEASGAQYTQVTPHLPNTSSSSIPQSKLTGLNLRDEEQETKFIEALKDTGVPVTDKVVALPEESEATPEPKPEPKKTTGAKKTTAAKPPAGASESKSEEEDVD